MVGMEETISEPAQAYKVYIKHSATVVQNYLLVVGKKENCLLHLLLFKMILSIKENSFFLRMCHFHYVDASAARIASHVFLASPSNISLLLL